MAHALALPQELKRLDRLDWWPVKAVLPFAALYNNQMRQLSWSCLTLSKAVWGLLSHSKEWM